MRERGLEGGFAWPGTGLTGFRDEFCGADFGSHMVRCQTAPAVAPHFNLIWIFDYLAFQLSVLPEKLKSLHVAL